MRFLILMRFHSRMLEHKAAAAFLSPGEILNRQCKCLSTILDVTTAIAFRINFEFVENF